MSDLNVTGKSGSNRLTVEAKIYPSRDNYLIKSHNLTFNLAKRIYDFGKIANIWECNFSNPDDAKRFADYFFKQEKEKYLKKLNNSKLN
jgi:hypothetical protein